VGPPPPLAKPLGLVPLPCFVEIPLLHRDVDLLRLHNHGQPSLSLARALAHPRNRLRLPLRLSAGRCASSIGERTRLMSGRIRVRVPAFTTNNLGTLLPMVTPPQTKWPTQAAFKNLA
jgi:hypothetical protein